MIEILKVVAWILFYVLFYHAVGFEIAVIVMLTQIFYKVIDIGYKQDRGENKL